MAKQPEVATVSSLSPPPPDTDGNAEKELLCDRTISGARHSNELTNCDHSKKDSHHSHSLSYFIKATTPLQVSCLINFR